MEPALLTPASIAALMREFDVRPSRALGQNFLADPNTARRIVRLAGLEAGDHVLEIGPGLGSLTLALAETGALVTALELDRHLITALASVVGALPDVTVVEGDAMTVDFATVASPAVSARWAVVANLPYNVATPLVVRILETAPWITTVLVMVQREVAERLAASPSTKAYGAVTVKVAYYGTAHLVARVPPTVFMPRPKVESALVRIDRHATPPVAVDDVRRLFVLVRAGFAQRRKTLRGALRPMLGDHVVEACERAGIDPGARAETLDLTAWAALAAEVAHHVDLPRDEEADDGA
jgi:16S rRNA (adenine1518-N6/adenine1519-N6)-dimethyltransferase